MIVALLSETENPAEYLEDEGWVVQEKLDGERMLVMRSKYQAREYDRVDAYNRRGERVECPDTVAAVAHLCSHSFIIDGEFVGGEFVAFDLIELNGVDCIELPQKARFAALGSVSPFRVVRQATDGKAAFVEAIRAARGEGVVFKDANAEYQHGRNAGMVKFRFWKSESFLVSDVDLLKCTMGLTRGGRDCGRCATSLSRLPVPGDVVEVRYLYAHKSGKLCQPVFLGARKDILPSDVANAR